MKMTATKRRQLIAFIRKEQADWDLPGYYSDVLQLALDALQTPETTEVTTDGQNSDD